jgi:hypothetical protein
MTMNHNPMETTHLETAWMPSSLPSCALYEKTPEIAVDLGVCLVVILRIFVRRHDVVTLRRPLKCHFGPLGFFKGS